MSASDADQLAALTAARGGVVTFDDLVRDTQGTAITVVRINAWLNEAQLEGVLVDAGTRRHPRDGLRGVRQYALAAAALQPA